MSKQSIIKLSRGINTTSLKAKNEVLFEENLSNDISETINRCDENNEVSQRRMLTVANAMFDSEYFSIFDDDCYLDEFLNSVYMIKIKSHLPALESTVQHLLEKGHTDRANAFHLQGDTYAFAIEFKSNNRFKKEIQNKALIYFDGKLNALCVVGKYYNNKLISVTSLPLIYLTTKSESRLKGEVLKADKGAYFLLEMNEKTGYSITMSDMENTKKSLAAINESSACCGLDIDFSF